MIYLFIILICIVSIIMLAVMLNINFGTAKQIKKIGYDKALNDITNKLPENIRICEEILEMVNNIGVNIKEQSSKQASLYLVVNNSIIIANIKDTFTRVQTIAHECLHSIQDKRLLWFNFIFSNIYIIYFVVITILSLCNILSNSLIHVWILTMFGFIFYFVRSFLEMDAMTKAEFVAKEYLNTKSDLLSQDEIDLIILNDSLINKNGIKLTLFLLLLSCFVKVIVFSLSSLY